ncbi:MAG: hypothetical protein NTY06_00530 [Candidatus Gottesmanbacteria bacterium]|nr:hypothetical protein [Candidatus Gottesmanbacteria bacterium]
MRNKTELSILGSLILIILGASLGFASGLMSEGDLFVGTATVILAGATFTLVFTEIEASRKERTREHLKERLEGLYSPLMGLQVGFDEVENHRHSVPIPFVYATMSRLRDSYSYLASHTLANQLDNYYAHFETGTRAITEGELESIHSQYKIDFDEITKEYRQLTISETEEKHRAEISKYFKKDEKGLMF